MKNIPFSKTLIACAASAWFIPNAVWAQSENDVLREVKVISATPLEGVGLSIDQIPSNVQVIHAKDDLSGANNLADLLNSNLGSVNIVNSTGNPFQNDVTYRGFMATSLLGAPVGLSVYLDGVRMNEPFGSNTNWDLIPNNAISSIQLLPGSNPMFGLNTLGGALSLTTKNGNDDAGMSLKSTVGSFGRKAFQFESGWVNQELGTDHFISANFDKQDGYRDHSGSDVKQLFGKTRWRGQGDAPNLELSMALADTSMNGTQALPNSMLNNPRSAYTWPDNTSNQMVLVNLKADKKLSENSLFVGNLFYRAANSKSLNSNANYDDGCTSVINEINQCYKDFITGTGTAKNTLTYGTTNPNPYNFARYTDGLNSSIVNGSPKQQTIGTNVQVTNFGKLSDRDNIFILGAALDFSKITYNQDTWLAHLVDYQTVIDFTNPRYYFGGSNPSVGTGGFSGSGLIKNVSLASKNTDLSLYLTDTLSVNERLDLTGALSYNITKLTQAGATHQYLNDDGGYSWRDDTNKLFYYNPSYIGQYVYKSTSPYYSTVAKPSRAGYTAKEGPQTSSLDGDHNYQRLNPAIGFSFTPNDDKRLNIFGSYSESMRAPTAIELSCADPASPCALPTGFNGDPDLKAVVAKTLELGSRGLIGQNSMWNAAIFDTRTANDIQFTFDGSNGLGYFKNVGATERVGMEFGISSKVDKLFISANYGYVNASYKSAFSAANGEVTAGNKMPGIANQNLKFRGAFNLTPELLIGANILRSGSQIAYGDETNTDNKVPGYTLLNLDIHYKVNKELILFGLVNNALNTKYYAYGLSGGTNIYTGKNEQFKTPGPARSLYVGLVYNFGGGSKKSAASKVDSD